MKMKQVDKSTDERSFFFGNLCDVRKEIALRWR